MPARTPGEVTRILKRIAAGEAAARDRLFEVAYNELRDLAVALLRRERPGHTLQPTALVNEAAARLLGSEALARGGNRAYFFGAMAQAMRRVLVDHARLRRTQRRGGDLQRVPLDELLAVVERDHRLDLVALDEALAQLEALSPRQGEIVVRRFFGGFAMREIAVDLDVSLSTVEKEWRMARAWLKHKLGERKA